MEGKPNVKLNFIGLVALVFGMMVGSGIFNIPQNMAAEAGPMAIILSWIVTAAGMLLLVFTFKTLSETRPDLNAGIYEYAHQGFGPFTGFISAWGYWLCASFANIAYAVMINDSFGTFFPILLDHGWPTVAFGSFLIWAFFLIVVNGMKTAKALTIILGIIKFSAIGLMLVMMALYFKVNTFSLDLFAGASTLDGLGQQVNSTMMVTLWCFIGIEGAAVMTGRALKKSDIGRASVVGFFSAWILYVLASLLCFGCMSRIELAGLENPSVAYVLREICGDWGFYFVIISVIISLLGGWLAWNLICAEVPYTCATIGLFPRCFLQLNRHGMPAFGLFISSLIMQAFLMLVTMAENVYLTALSVTSMMMLPSYLLSGAYLAKISRGKNRILGIACTLFCIWFIFAGGVDLFLGTALYYLVGFPFYFRARKERGLPALTPGVVVFIAVIFAITVLYYG